MAAVSLGRGARMRMSETGNEVVKLVINQSKMDKEVVVVVVVTLKTSFILGNQPKYLNVLMIMDEVYT